MRKRSHSHTAAAAPVKVAVATLTASPSPALWKKRWIFILGGVLGAVSIGVVNHRPITAAALSLTELNFDALDLTSFFDSLDSGAFASINQNIKEFMSRSSNGFEVGKAAHARGQRAKFPIVLIPGIISSGLESWGTSNETLKYFRKGVWGGGGMSMLRTAATDKTTWLKMLTLDPVTGLDEKGYECRSVIGLSAADSFVPGYWIWSKIIENLAVVGYTSTDLTMASYDWRLAFHNLEIRDSYFSLLKSQIELNLKLQKKKSVLVAHSMGTTVVLHFLKWVEAPDGLGGGGGDAWVETHIESLVNIAGTLLGVPKAVSSLLSGEMRDTVELNSVAALLLERFLSKAERAALFRSWAGSSSMLLKGGSAVWGNTSWAPDDTDSATFSSGSIIRFKDDASLVIPQNLTVDEVHSFLAAHSPASFQEMLLDHYSNGFERSTRQVKKNNLDSRKWSNPLEVSLPYAPSMKIYSLYGHGKETERAYFYRSDDDPANGLDKETRPRKSVIDHLVTLETSTPRVANGVIYGEGDGTVALLSLGAMSARGWKEKRYNPASIPIVTREFAHDPVLFDPREGDRSSDHINLLGGRECNEAILDIVTGHGDRVTSRFVSRIREYAERIDWSATD